MPRSATSVLDGPPVPVLDSLLTPEQLAHRLGLTPRTLASWRERSTGPAYIRIGGRYPRYRPEDVDEWLLSQRHQGTAEER